MKVDPHYDLLIVGGGITGAAVLHAASRRGLHALLVDRGDFAGGTSSWSSKLIHGGMRYLKSGQWRMTLESVRERERLLEERPGLVEPQPFVMPIHQGTRPGPFALGAAFWIADRMAGRHTARRRKRSRSSRRSTATACAPRSPTATASSTTPGWCCA